MAYVPKSAQRNRGNAIDRAKRESRVFGGNQNGRPGTSKTPTPAAIKSATKIAKNQPPNPKGAKAFDRARGLAKKTIVPTSAKKVGARPSGSRRTTPSPNPAPSPATAPFLTPAQQKALSDFDATYGYNLGALRRKEGDATANTNQQLAAATKVATINTNNANQSAAARGIFQSSIRDGDLNDIDATLAMRNNTLNTNLNRLMLDTNSQMGHLTTDWTNTHNFYNSMAVANAQAVPPVVPAPATPTTSAAGSSGAAASGSSSSANGGTPAGTGGGGGRIQGSTAGRPPRGPRRAPWHIGGTGYTYGGPATAQYFNGVGVPR